VRGEIASSASRLVAYRESKSNRLESQVARRDKAKSRQKRKGESVGRHSDKGIEEHSRSSSRKGKKVLEEANVLRGVWDATKWYQSGDFFAFYSRVENSSCR
jgi:hypothetical protein